MKKLFFMLICLFIFVTFNVFSTTRIFNFGLNFETDRYSKNDATEFYFSPGFKYTRVGQDDRDFGFFSSHYFSAPVLYKVKVSGSSSEFKSTDDFLGYFNGIVGFGAKLPLGPLPFKVIVGAGGAYYLHTHYYNGTDSERSWGDHDTVFDAGVGVEADFIYKIIPFVGIHTGLIGIYKFSNSANSSRFLFSANVGLSFVLD